MPCSNLTAPGYQPVPEGRSVTAEVIAVFNRCCYLKLQDQHSLNLLCVGHTSIEPGPINFLLDDNCWQTLQPLLKTGAVARLGHNQLTLAGLSFELPTGDPYQSPALARFCRTSQPLIQDRLELLARQSQAGSLFVEVVGCDSTAPEHASVDTASLDSTIQAYLAPLVHALRAELCSVLRNDCATADLPGLAFASAQQLLGAGAGLTPAGDDLLAGVMLALRFFNQPAAADLFSAALKPRLSASTNVISAALITQAGAGRTSLPLVNLFAALGDPAGTFNARALAQGIDAIGHSSGWDCVAGIALVTQALLQSRLCAASKAVAAKSPSAPTSTTTRFSMHA